MPGERPQGPILLGAFGDPGHAFPMIALGRALVDRGHDVVLQTWRRWREHVEAEGMAFAAAPEYHTAPAGPGEVGFYEAAELATPPTLALVRELGPRAVVADILTLAPALAAELQGVPWATLIPHVYPVDAPGLPIYSLGARMPRTRLGRAGWEAAKRPVRAGVEQGRRELNAVRARLGLPALVHGHGGISRRLTLVATFPQLEYPRPWPPGARIVGPLLWQPGGGEDPVGEGALAAGNPRRERDGARDAPLVLLAPSTSQDPEQRLLRAALEGLAGAPVRVIASVNRSAPRGASEDPAQGGTANPPDGDIPPRAGTHDTSLRRGEPADLPPLPRPDNATIVEWLSYARVMPRCDVAVCHAGHGTIARALASGCPIVACPAAGDMNENAARVAWAGAGVRVPRRFIRPRPIRLAVERVLADPSIGARARELSAWAATNDAPGTAARLVEELAGHRTAKRLRGWDSNPQPLG